MKFIPYYDKILIRPIEEKRVIASTDQRYEQKGEVLAVGEGVQFVKAGDIVYFLSHGVWKTPKADDGTQHWLVSNGEGFILGKDVAE